VPSLQQYVNLISFQEITKKKANDLKFSCYTFVWRDDDDDNYNNNNNNIY